MIRTQPKIHNLHLKSILLRQQYILWFQVSMDVVPLVNILHSLNNTFHYLTDFTLFELLRFLE